MGSLRATLFGHPCAAALALTLAVAVTAAGCSCEAAPPPDDAGLPFDDVGPRAQPCTDGIRRFDVEGIPVLANEADAITKVVVDGDAVLLARSDVGYGGVETRALFARVDGHDGHLLGSGFADIGSLAYEPIAIRSAPDGTTEILYLAPTLALVIARFGPDGDPLPTQRLDVTPVRTGRFGAVPTERGFLFVANAYTGHGEEMATFALELVDGAALPVALSGERPLGSLTLSSADGRIAWVTEVAFPPAEWSVRITRIDLASPSTPPTFVDIPLESTGGYDTVTLDAAPDGTAVLLVATDELDLRWIGSDLVPFGEWRAPTPARVAGLVGVAGAMPNQGIALWDSTDPTGVRFARAYAAGDVGGGLDVIVDVRADDPPAVDFGRRTDGAYTLAWWEGGLSVVTFCEPR
jgi:hypothetical protein